MLSRETLLATLLPISYPAAFLWPRNMSNTLLENTGAFKRSRNGMVGKPDPGTLDKPPPLNGRPSIHGNPTPGGPNLMIENGSKALAAVVMVVLGGTAVLVVLCCAVVLTGTEVFEGSVPAATGGLTGAWVIDGVGHQSDLMALKINFPRVS